MLSRLFLRIFIFGLFFNGSWSWWNSRKKLPEAIWKTADSKIGLSTWALQNNWRGDNDYKEKWKCNLFVYDVLLEAGARPVKRRWWGHTPIGANEWANPSSRYVLRNGCYRTVSEKNMKKGDIIAFGREGNSGHMGIVSNPGNFISAGKYTVTDGSIKSFRARNNISRTTLWRYVC